MSSFKGFPDPLKPRSRISLALGHLRFLAEREHMDEKWGCINCNSERNFGLTYAKQVRTSDRMQCWVTSWSSRPYEELLGLEFFLAFRKIPDMLLSKHLTTVLSVTELRAPQLDQHLECRNLRRILLSPRTQHST